MTEKLNDKLDRYPDVNMSSQQNPIFTNNSKF